jgi:hypothetical protein
MASIVPPLDFIPKLPGKGVELLTAQLDILLDQLLEKVSTTVQDTVKLPIDCKCDDPRIKKIKAQLAQIQEQITKVQESIPKIQQAIDTVKTVVSTAQAIKATISAAQLSNPVTAPVFIAQQLTAIQDATIVNALASLQQFSTLPNTLTSKLTVLVPPLLGALSKVSSACDGNVDNLELPDTVLSKLSSSVDYNDAVNTEFYNEFNVSDIDISDRSSNIQSLIKQQQDLLTSLQEAPSKVYKQQGIPDNTLGKPGDYYINLTTMQIYGPKPSATDWGTPVN